MKTSRFALSSLAVVMASAWLGLAMSVPALAHETLVSSDPADAGLIETLPSRARLVFSAEVREVHEITVTGPDGSVVNGTATTSGAEVRQNLWGGPDGAYVLTYDVVSSDGHDVSGEVRFEVGSLPVGASGETRAAAAESEPGTSGRRTILLAGSVLLVGLAVQLGARRTLARKRS